MGDKSKIEAIRRDAARYRWLRERDLDTIDAGGVFAGQTPQNLVLNGEDLDRAIDAAMGTDSRSQDDAHPPLCPHCGLFRRPHLCSGAAGQEHNQMPERA